MSQLLEKSGKIVFLRAHDLGTKFGPPTDQLDVEAVFILNALSDGALGFQLRNDANLPARQAMFSLLRDAFVNNLNVIADFLIDPPKKNGVAIRVALTRPLQPNPKPVVKGTASARGEASAAAGRRRAKRR